MVPPARPNSLGLIVAVCFGLSACGAGGDIAARAGDGMLTAERLTEIMTAWGRSPRDSGLARQVADWWVEYQLFADRVVSGDSMLDSATVFAVLWTEARAYILARWRERLFVSQLPLDSGALDSIYRAGDYRLMQHVLFRAPARGPPEEREGARRRAVALRERLGRGLSWQAAQQQNDDLPSRGRSGSVGVIVRGQSEPGFEDTAFALEPGAISGVLASSYGYHLARRPPLREVRAEFRDAVEPLVAQRLDSLYMQDLAERWRLTLGRDRLERARQAVRHPLRHVNSRAVIATFDGGEFTQQDLVRWLAAVPDLVHSEVERGTEQQLIRFLERMMRYELLYREARNHNVTTSPEEFTQLKSQLAGRLNELKELLQVYPPATGDSASVGELRHRAAQRVEVFLLTRPNDWQRFARVPPLLADRLKERARWALHPAGVARAIRLMEERSAGARDAPPADPSGDTTRVPH